MAQLNLGAKWIFELSSFELRLVLQSLRGQVKDGDEQKATELGDHLTVLKAKQITQMAHENEKLIESLKEAGLWNKEE